MRFRNPWKIISGTAVAAVVIGGASIQISKLLSGDESFYQTLAMPLLHRLDPEIAHKLAIKCASLGLVPRQSVQDPIELVSLLTINTVCTLKSTYILFSFKNRI